ncbi:xanthine dehydrogenase molybdenum binding subunit apoprotein [Trinickia symbiotica]|uniref:Xanthine dehydrogenase family protein molybdopterin-binding subunit n=1 Tax=Trinickia symbiotica TaxID=863227 RepID=A0A2N7X2U1_9BURK|nr:xanthine dehydrogenase family protein molybdopterin-binding subunit [Trinickia symbiotica]PMS35795.1 xanthine dehydrogenase family protein molybdopterin-binding subunit [Trinickia symbiotica]PPK44575.1 xanthine dehydrogenase molybdenum binding subunit apoprotein [Trinickia symbiotica]
MNMIGQPLDRTDGVLKVTGQAQYGGEFPAGKLAHGVLVTSTIARGNIASIDTSIAENLPGVILVMTYRNAPRLPNNGRPKVTPPALRRLSLLQDDEVHYNNEPIAVVVAETFEQATHAADALRVSYRQAAPALDFQAAKANAHPPPSMFGGPPDTKRGNVESGLREGSVRIDAVYTTPMETHNPMEPHAVLALWDGPRLTLYDTTQGVANSQQAVATTLGIAREDVHVISPFVGGGFGCKGSVWSHVVLCAMASRQTGRPVRLALTRPQMFGPVGGRPYTEQHISVAARSDGTITGLRHDTFANTSVLEDWTETSGVVTRMLYATPNLDTTHRLVPMNVGIPTFMRAPGETTGTYALESALDELAYALKMDPVELRLKNYAEVSPEEGKPWSSKHLRECYRVGAERFGWSKRPQAVRSLRDGDTLIGMGMATATYPAHRSEASAIARIMPDGTAVVVSGTQDIGTGTYTIMTQVAADALGFPVDRVSFGLGDSSLPRAPISGGSQSAASVSPAVHEAASAARAQLIALARADEASPLHGLAVEDVTVVDGWVVSRSQPTKRDPAAAIIARAGSRPIEATATAKSGDESKRFESHSFGAVFTEVHVDAALGVIRVPRVVAVYDVGRLLNEKTGKSQLMGGLVWGIGAALEEESSLDTRYGRFVNGNLAEYHVPVNGDIGTIDVTVLDVPDTNFNPLGARGIGEIGITGIVAAVANGVYHATGVRVRDLPITLDKVMMQMTA